MSIKLTKSICNKPATLRLLNHISSYLFEEEYNELSNVKSSDINKIKDIVKVLNNILKSNKK